MTAGTAGRATVRRAAVKVTVKPRCSPGRVLFRDITRKRAPVIVEDLPDTDLLRVLLGDTVAAAVEERLRPHGGLSAFHLLGAAGPRGLLDMPGVDEANAARLLVLFEISARISEPFRALPDDD